MDASGQGWSHSPESPLAAACCAVSLSESGFPCQLPCPARISAPEQSPLLLQSCLEPDGDKSNLPPARQIRASAKWLCHPVVIQSRSSLFALAFWAPKSRPERSRRDLCTSLLPTHVHRLASPPAVSPPSIVNTCPVAYAASSDAR